MILIFDLDDTLYEERLFVESGLRAVARHGSTTFGLDPEASFLAMRQVLLTQGRGKIFDVWLAEHGLANRQRIAECVKIYRHHVPKISLPQAHANLLSRLKSSYPLYLVTDGHKITQQRKLEALRISHYFQRVFITHRFGVRQAKPSLHCFEKVKQAERCDWSKLLYVGDNPAKDFVNLNRVGAVTIRVHTGPHADCAAKAGFDAAHHIDKLLDFEPILARLDVDGP